MTPTRSPAAGTTEINSGEKDESHLAIQNGQMLNDERFEQESDGERDGNANELRLVEKPGDQRRGARHYQHRSGTHRDVDPKEV